MSKLTINTRINEEVTILDLSGELTNGYGARALSRMLRRMNLDGRFHVLLNFTAVTGLDEAGMNVLADSAQNHVRGDNHIKLFGIDKRRGRMKTNMVTLTHLLTFFDVFDDENGAVASFRQQDVDLLAAQNIVRTNSRTFSRANDQAARHVYDDDGGRFTGGKG